MQKKFTAYVLVVTLLVLNIFSVIALDAPSFSIDLGVLQSNMITKYGSGDNHTQTQTDNAKIYLKDQLGTTTYNTKYEDYHANVGIMLRYGILVYTHEDDNYLDYKGFDDYARDDNGIYQYRYLGLRQDCDVNAPVTNSLYPNVEGTTTFFSTYMNKNFIEKKNENSENSWDIPKDEIKNYMLYDKGLAVQDSGITVPNASLSISDILDKQTGGVLSELTKFSTFLTSASTKYYGEVKVWHMVGIVPYYRTILVDPIDFAEPEMIIEFDKDEYIFADNEQTKNLTGKATLVFPSFKRIGGWSIADYIEKAYITIDGNEKKVNVIGDIITTDFSIEVDRDRFKIGEEQDFIVDGSFKLIAYEYLKNDEIIGNGVGATSVLVNPGQVEAKFSIDWYKGVGVTEPVKDSTIDFEEWDRYQLDLTPEITVYGENEVEDVAWIFDSSVLNEVKSGTQTSSVRFIMDESKKDTHLTDNKANFTMYVNLKYPITVTIDEKEVVTSQLIRTGWVEFIEGIPEEEILTPQNLPPVAKITAPDTIKQGELFKFSGGRSYDKDGEVVDYDFYGDLEITKMYTNSRGRGTFLDTGDENIRLRVYDNDDLSDTEKETIEVTTAVDAVLQVDGKRTVNRRITLNGSQSTGSYYFPINNYTWTIEPLDRQSMNSIKYDTDNTGEYCDVLFKESGAYQVTLTAKASCTFTGETSRTSQDTVSYPITIQPDLPPVAQLNVYSLSLRDKLDGLQATIESVDASYSSDGDQTSTEWYYCFDSDNDKSIADETWTAFGTGENLESIKVDHVGQYYFYNVTTDVIPDADTIPRFLTESDYLSDSSLENALNQVCLVDNVSPVISSTGKLEKIIDVAVITDETSYYTQLVSELYRLRMKLYERKISLNSQVYSTEDIELLNAGSKKIQTFIWNRVVHIFLRWNWYESYDGSRTMLQNIVRESGGIVESKQGTLEEMIDFPTYPDAYAEVVGYNVDSYESSSGVHRYRFESAIVDVYNGLNDFFKQIETGYLVGMSYNNSKDYSYYSSDGSRPSVGSTDSWYAINKTPKVDTSESYSSWEIGELVSEEDGDFNTIDLDPILSQYSDSENDKYLIFALANGENFFMTDAMRNQIINEGYKVYFSMDEFWSEFKPTPSEATAVRLDDDGGLYALTKYGNAQYNYSSADDVYYSQRANEDRTQYSLDLESLGFKTIQADTGGIYLPVAYLKNVGVTGYDNDARAWHFPTVNGVFYPYNKVKYMYTYGSADISKVTWTLQTYSSGSVTIGDETFEIVRGYSFKGGTGAIVETTEGEFYYISPSGGGNNNTSNGSTRVETLSYTKLDISGIDAVYNRGFVKGNISTIVQSELRDVTVYDEIETNCGGMREDVFIIKDSAGGYVFLKPKHTAAIYEKRISMSAYPLIFYFNDLSDVRIHTKDITFYDIYSNRTLYKTIGYVDLYYLYSKSKGGPTFEEIRSKMDFFMPHSNYQFLEYYTYTLIDENGDVYIDDKKRISGAQSADYNASVATYVDAQGNVKGAGYPVNGEIGQNEYSGSFIDVFNTPYTLDALYAQEKYANILDFVSRTPQAIRTDRGDYEPIIDAILEQYESYSTDETILVTVGDEVDMSVQVLDFEGDPIIEKTVEITPVPNYFDNETGVIDIPENIDEPFVIDKAGKAEYRLRGKDNPVGNNDLFDEYRYWNKDNTTITIIAHRKPIAKLTYDLVPVTDGVFTFIGDYTNSYDLDHSISRADKGIVDYRYYYRTEYQGEWTQFDGTLALERGLVYHFALQVKDLEGSWSDYDTADIEVNGELFILNGSIDPPYPTGVPAGDTITISADILTDKIIDTVTATIEGESSTVSLSKDSAIGNNQTWLGTCTIPTTKTDKDYYSVELTATASDGSTRVYPLKINIYTPVDLTGEIEPYSIKKGQTATLTAETSLYVDRCSASIFNDLYGGTADEINISMSKDTVSGSTQKWTGTYPFDSSQLDSIAEGEYEVLFDASTTNGNTQTCTDTFEFVPNTPPVVTIESVEPSFIYEGDDVKVVCRVRDADLDSLDIIVELSNDDGLTWTDYMVLSNYTVVDLSGETVRISIDNVVRCPYRVRIRAVDPFGEEGRAITAFSAELLSVEGAVHHTSKWNENRIQFNRVKSDTEDAPRPYSVFWPGEKLLVEARTSQISSGAQTYCMEVRTYIEEEPIYSVILDKCESYFYEGQIWAEEMLEWKERNLKIVFEAVYSNGIVRTDRVEIQINNSEPYWLRHKLF